MFDSSRRRRHCRRHFELSNTFGRFLVWAAPNQTVNARKCHGLSSLRSHTRIKRFCFISSPGNGLTCCCCCCRPDYPIRRGRHRKWKEAPEPNPHPMRAVETERRRKTAGREALRRSDERRSAKGGRSRRRRCSPSTTSASRPLTRRP